MKQTDKVPVVEGAAEYYADGNNIWMEDNVHRSVIDSKRTHEQALKAAKIWQRKENRAVLKSKGII